MPELIEVEAYRQLAEQALATARVAALPKVEQDVGDELRLS